MRLRGETGNLTSTFSAQTICASSNQESSGQKQLRQSVKLMMPCGVIPQHCMFYIHTDSNTHWHTHRHTHQHTQGFSSPPHSNLLPVWELSSSRLDWQKLNKMPFRSTSSMSSSRISRRGSLHLSGTELLTPAVKRPAGTLRKLPPCPVVRAVSIRQPAHFGPRAAPWSPRCLSGAPLSSFREPCNKKSRLWRHTMWKGGRFKKEKNASKNNKSQL